MSQALERAGGATSWEAYAALARELDAVRAAEAARTAGVRQAVAQMSEHADGLGARLREQETQLVQLGRQLRIRTGKLSPIAPDSAEEPMPVLSDVAANIDVIDRNMTEAADRGRYPALLPRWPAFTRNLLIYGICAAAVIVAQFQSFSASDLDQGKGPNPLVVLLVIPLIGLAVGYLAATAAGRTRLEESRVRANPRLGFLLCFGIGPVIFAWLMIDSLMSR